MNKVWSFIKVSLNHDMNVFKINTKKNNKFTKVLLPLLLASYIMIILGVYAYKLIGMLKPVHMEFVCLTIFGIAISFLTLIEGIYKSSSLLFNCKDDNMVFSLPIKKSTVLFVRVLKFYIFEFLYNSLFFLPAVIVYAYYLKPGFTFYLSSLFALLLLPIVPIVLSCLIGFIITYLSSKFKGKNIFQTIITIIFILGVFYVSYNTEGLLNDIASKASDINDLLTRLYYPVGAYITLINSFNIKTLIIYILSHVALFAITLVILGKFYFYINSGFKKVLVSHKKNNNYKIKTHSRLVSFVKKELNRFLYTPVYITNAGFGLVLFILACIYASVRYDSLIANIIKSNPNFDINSIRYYIPTIMFGLICFSSLMTSITSSMISLEGKSFSILKSLPIKPAKIVLYKVLSAMAIMVPCILIGDIIIFIKFKFEFLSIILILLSSIILPFVSELIGIIINLKYPKLDATNDTEVVKQSMSSMLSVFIGMGLSGLTIIFLIKMVTSGVNNSVVLPLLVGIYGIIALILLAILYKTCDKLFNNISV